MSAVNVQVQELPLRARPAFVVWQAGGRQDFPVDAIADAYITRNSRDALAREGRRPFVRRVPKEEVAA